MTPQVEIIGKGVTKDIHFRGSVNAVTSPDGEKVHAVQFDDPNSAEIVRTAMQQRMEQDRVEKVNLKLRPDSLGKIYQNDEEVPGSGLRLDQIDASVI